MNYSETKQLIINQYFKDHYSFINKMAVKSLKRINRTDLVPELISEVFFQITEDSNNIERIVLSGMIESCVIQVVNKQVYWRNTPFKTKYLYNQKNMDFVEDFELFENEVIEDDEDTVFEKEMEISNKLGYVYTYYAGLTKEKKTLFNLIYNKGLDSSGKLAKHLGISRGWSYKIMKELKEELRNGYNN